MKRLSTRQVFLAACGLSTVVSLGALGEVAMGQAVPKTGGCVDKVSELHLGLGIDAVDARLQGPSLIVVHKAKRHIQRFHKGVALKLDHDQPACWRVGLGPSPEGHKYRRGDGRTPEGWYRTSDKPWSQFYGAIAIHYPNARDAQAGRVQGRIPMREEREMRAALTKDKKPLQSTALGGEILIHGQGSLTDWTLGCVAMDNADLDALRRTLPRSMRTDVLVLP